MNSDIIQGCLLVKKCDACIIKHDDIFKVWSILPNSLHFVMESTVLLFLDKWILVLFDSTTYDFYSMLHRNSHLRLAQCFQIFVWYVL